MLAFLLRAALAILHCYVFKLPDSQADAAMFELTGWVWATKGWETILNNFTTNAYLYSWLISVLYALTDRSSLMIQGVNVLLGTLSVYLVWRITLLVSGGNSRPANTAAWIAALFPTLILYSAIILREELMIFFFLIGVLYSLRWWQRLLFRHFLIACLAFGLAGAFNTGMLVMLVVLAMLALIRWGQAILANKGTSFLRVTAALGLLVVLSALVMASGWGLGAIGILRSGVTSIGQFQDITAMGRAAYLTDLTMQSTWDVVWQTLIRLAYFLFTPFPWMIRETIDIIGFIDALLYVGLVLLISVNWKYIWSNSLTRIVVLFLAVGLVIFALGTSNYGTAIRHRSKFAPLLIVVAVVATWRPELDIGRQRTRVVLSH
jgi:hypothetical protein